jgi:hypothetical protein
VRRELAFHLGIYTFNVVLLCYSEKQPCSIEYLPDGLTTVLRVASIGYVKIDFFSNDNNRPGKEEKGLLYSLLFLRGTFSS